MTATNYSFLCEQGASFNEVVTWKNEAGAVIDNTGYTAQMQVRKEVNDTPAVAMTTGNGKIVLGGSNGQIQLLLAASDTAALTPADYLYDLELVSPSGVASRVLEGVFSVSVEITRS